MASSAIDSRTRDVSQALLFTLSIVGDSLSGELDKRWHRTQERVTEAKSLRTRGQNEDTEISAFSIQDVSVWASHRLFDHLVQYYEPLAV